MTMRSILSNQLIRVALGLIGFTVGLANAATVAEEQDILARLEQSLENRQASVDEIGNDLLGNRNRLAGAQADLDQATKELASAKADLATAEQAFNADASQNNGRTLKKVQHSHKMAERGVRSRTKRLERVSGNVKELEAQLAAGEKAVAGMKSRIQRQEKRLSDMIASLESQVKQGAATAGVSEVDPVVSTPPPPVAPPAPAKKAVAEKVVAEKAAPPSQPVSAAAAEQVSSQVSELDREALAYAQEEMSKLEAFLAAGQAGRPSYRRLFLKGSKVQSTSFEFLGRNQYRAEVPVTAGRQLFEIGNHKFRRTIPAADDGEAYVFIYDARRLSRPRLAIFKKSLLEGL